MYRIVTKLLKLRSKKELAHTVASSEVDSHYQSYPTNLVGLYAGDIR
jgi:hypothetical protein